MRRPIDVEPRLGRSIEADDQDHDSGAHDLDPGLWLRRLSHDPVESVRAAAVRRMSKETVIDLTDRIDQMARSDPSPTVAQLARYYLTRKRQGCCQER